MKNSIFFLIVIAFFLTNACNTSCKDKVNVADEIVAIEGVLEHYIIANETQDFAMIEQIWAPSSDIILFGTNSDEVLIGWTNIRNAIKGQFTAIEDTYISASDQFIKLNDCGNTAWVAESLDYNFIYKGEAHSYTGMRFTGVLSKIDGNWRFVQIHLSVPANIDLSK